MRSFLAIAAACLISAVSAELTCDDCLSWTGALEARLESEEILAEQTEVLVRNVCPQAKDPAGCEAGFNTWWAGIGKAMYPVFLEANAICGEIGACKVKSLVAEPTCDDCTGGIGAIAGVISSKEVVGKVIDFLKGDGFCGANPDAGACGKFIEGTIPYSMPVLAEVLNVKASELCCDVPNLCC